jgi:hypothetical protein
VALGQCAWWNWSLGTQGRIQDFVQGGCRGCKSTEGGCNPQNQRKTLQNRETKLLRGGVRTPCTLPLDPPLGTSVFAEGGLGTTFEAREGINDKLNLHVTPSLGIELGSQWWKARALTAAPPTLPLKNDDKNSKNDDAFHDFLSWIQVHAWWFLPPPSWVYHLLPSNSESRPNLAYRPLGLNPNLGVVTIRRVLLSWEFDYWFTWQNIWLVRPPAWGDFWGDLVQGV